jgi:AcrR family transcriptional regulator
VPRCIAHVVNSIAAIQKKYRKRRFKWGGVALKRSVKDATETRRRIVEVAQKLFTDKGFAATSIDQIAKGADVTEGAIFHYFKSKKRLYGEIVEGLQREYDNAVRAEAAKGTSAMDAILRASRASITLAREKSFSRLVMLDGPAVLGESEWRELDSSMGLLSAEMGIRAITAGQDLPDPMIKSMSVMLLGMLNETIFALVRKQPGVTVESSLAVIERTLRMWAGDKVTG